MTCYYLASQSKCRVIRCDDLDFVVDVECYFGSLPSFHEALSPFDVNSGKTLLDCIKKLLGHCSRIFRELW
jgi:hypothetical protein